MSNDLTAGMSRGDILGVTETTSYAKSAYEKAMDAVPTLPAVPGIVTAKVQEAYDAAYEATEAAEDVAIDNRVVLGDVQQVAEAQLRAAAKAAVEEGQDPSKLKSPLADLMAQRARALGTFDALNAAAVKAVQHLKVTLRAEANASAELAASALIDAEAAMSNAYSAYAAATVNYRNVIAAAEQLANLTDDPNGLRAVNAGSIATRSPLTMLVRDAVNADDIPANVHRRVRSQYAARYGVQPAR